MDLVLHVLSLDVIKSSILLLLPRPQRLALALLKEMNLKLTCYTWVAQYWSALANMLYLGRAFSTTGEISALELL